MLKSELSSITSSNHFQIENSHNYLSVNINNQNPSNNNTMVKRELVGSDDTTSNKRIKTEDDQVQNQIKKSSGSGSSKKSKSNEVMIKGAWSPEEDKEMLKAVAKFGTDWKSISKCVRGRTAKQCRDRYKLKLDPSINHGPWTPEEDQTLLNLHAQLGRQWTKIAKLMKGRTENSVKSRYASLERSRTREWTEEEDATLRAHKEQEVSFEDIAKFHLPHRSEHAVKKRWERLFMRDLARKIRSEMPSLKNSNATSTGPQQYKNKSPFPINPRLLPTAVAPSSTEQIPQQQQQQQKPHVDFVVPTGNSTIPGNSNPEYGYPPENNMGSDPFAPQNAPDTLPIDIKGPIGGMMQQPQMQPPPKKSSRQSKFKRHSTSVTVMMQLIGEPLNK